MTSTRLPNYLRAARKRAGLTARDLAMLLGHRTSAAISRYEGFERRPTLASAVLLEIALGVPMSELFPRLYEDGREKLEVRAVLLLKRLDGRPATRRLQGRRRQLRRLAGEVPTH